MLWLQIRRMAQRATRWLDGTDTEKLTVVSDRPRSCLALFYDVLTAGLQNPRVRLCRIGI